MVSWVSSTARAMPKSITLGPSGARITLAGLRSRCTIPAACTPAIASAIATASAWARAGGIGPWSMIRRLSVGPGT